MAKERLFDLNQTKGTFQIKGKVFGVSKDSFYKEGSTKNGKDYRRINFGIEYNDKKTIYIELMGMPQENVYYCSRDNETKKTVTEKVPWANRFNFSKEGYRMIGMNLGLTKTTDKDGKIVNDKKVLTDFDACKYIHENLKDDQSVFIKGEIQYGSFKDDKGNVKRTVKLIPKQISLCSDDIDFSDDDYKEAHDFNQVIVFRGIEKEKDVDGGETGRFVVHSSIVNYASIESADFIMENAKLAKTFKNKIKEYNAIKVSGHIVAQIETTEVEDDDDEWGEADAMEKQNTPIKREYIITGAKGSSLDTELYSKKDFDDAEKKIKNANKAEKDFNSSSNKSSNDDWGDTSSLDDADDDDGWD